MHSTKRQNVRNSRTKKWCVPTCDSWSHQGLEKSLEEIRNHSGNYTPSSTDENSVNYTNTSMVNLQGSSSLNFPKNGLQISGHIETNNYSQEPMKLPRTNVRIQDYVVPLILPETNSHSTMISDLTGATEPSRYTSDAGTTMMTNQSSVSSVSSMVSNFTLVNPMIEEEQGPNYDFIEEEGFYRAESIEVLNQRLIEDYSESDCKSTLQIFGWDINRLKLRERIPGRKKPMPAPKAKTYLKEIVGVATAMGKTMQDHILMRIDEALYMVKHHRDCIYIHDTPQVTGKAVEAEESLDPTKSALVYDNPLFLFKNMTVDQLQCVADLIQLECAGRKVELLSKLCRYWAQAADLKRKELFVAVGAAFTFLKIKAPVTPRYRAVSSQVLYMVKGSEKVSNNLIFKVLLTTIRNDEGIFILCAPMPRQRMGVEKTKRSQISHVVPVQAPLQTVVCDLYYPRSMCVTVNKRNVVEGVSYDYYDLVRPKPISE